MHDPSRRAVSTLRGVKGCYSLVYVAVAVLSVAEALDRRDIPTVAWEYQHQALGANTST